MQINLSAVVSPAASHNFHCVRSTALVKEISLQPTNCCRNPPVGFEEVARGQAIGSCWSLFAQCLITL